MVGKALCFLLARCSESGAREGRAQPHVVGGWRKEAQEASAEA